VTSVPDSIDARAREALIAGYEELRRTVLGRAGGSGRGVGFALFVRGGMAGWMATCAVLPRPPNAPVAQRSVAEKPLVPQDFRVEVATLLAEMALSAHAQGAMTT
jgi:hypothetical protein